MDICNSDFENNLCDTDRKNPTEHWQKKKNQEIPVGNFDFVEGAEIEEEGEREQESVTWCVFLKKL